MLFRSPQVFPCRFPFPSVPAEPPPVGPAPGAAARITVKQEAHLFRRSVEHPLHPVFPVFLLSCAPAFVADAPYQLAVVAVSPAYAAYLHCPSLLSVRHFQSVLRYGQYAGPDQQKDQAFACPPDRYDWLFHSPCLLSPT